MKRKFLVVLTLVMTTLNVNAAIPKNTTNQDPETVTVKGIFDGYDYEDGYAFVIKDEDGDEEYMFFEAITDSALKTADLMSAKLLGKRFEITYEITEYNEEDEDGNIETFQQYTIVKLKKL